MNFFFIIPVFIFLTGFDLLPAPKMLIKFPTRERSEKALACIDLYYKNLSGSIPCHFLVSCDSDDSTMNCKGVIDKLKSYPNLTLCFGPRVNKIEAVNRDIQKYPEFDILLIISDDMTPIIKGYDQIIANYMLKYFPDFDGVLHFNDGRVGKLLNTLAIMGKKYYDRFKFVYYPGYKSVCCDVEMTVVSNMLNKVAYIDDVIIRHDHPSFGFKPDSLFYKNESKEYHDHDILLLFNRMSQNFYLEQNDIKFPVNNTLNIFGHNNNIKWSILIPSLESNRLKFSNLFLKILKQLKKHNLEQEIEVIFLRKDDYTNERKRQELVMECKGNYFNFLNENENVSDDYIIDTYKKLKDNPKSLKFAIFKK